MLDNIRKKLADLAQQQREKYKINASQFDDPIAEITQWSPLKSGGANFKTHQLQIKSANILRYKLSTGGIVFISLFAVIGLIVLIVGITLLFNGTGESWIAIIFGAVFSGVSFLMFKYMGQPIVFDKAMGLIWKGKKPIKFAGDHDKSNMIYMSKIHAIQIIAERVRGNKTTYFSYEINLVLTDGNRFNVVDHGNLSQILVDAEEISTFLDKPIWNAS